LTKNPTKAFVVRCSISSSKLTKNRLSAGSGGAHSYSAPPNPLAELRGPPCDGEGRQKEGKGETERKERNGGKEGKERPIQPNKNPDYGPGVDVAAITVAVADFHAVI